jgi:predicted dehydrogenase
MYRLHPSWVAAQELVASGHIGQLRSVHGQILWRSRTCHPAGRDLPDDSKEGVAVVEAARAHDEAPRSPRM